MDVVYAPPDWRLPIPIFDAVDLLDAVDLTRWIYLTRWIVVDIDAEVWSNMKSNL